MCLSLELSLSLFSHLHFVEDRIEPLEILLPYLAVALEPVDGFRERFALYTTGSPLRITPAGDETSLFEHAKML